MVRGFDKEDDLFLLFNDYRLQESQQPHELAINYSDENYFLDKQLRFFIGFDKSIPVLFSSIFRLEWWPQGAYRILNRLWKPEKDQVITKEINLLFFEMVKEQVNWLKTKNDFKVAFVSRQGNSASYLDFFSEKNREYGNNMYLFDHPIRTCMGPDVDCLQNVAYIGNQEILRRWNSDTRTNC